jgi:putative SOS response-associated peptidase YedK
MNRCQQSVKLRGRSSRGLEREAAEGSQAGLRRSGTLDRMCYSAKLSQSLKEYLRLTGAVADLPQMETVFERRLIDSSVRIPRGFERNFDEPKSEQEQRLRSLLDRYRESNVTKLEQELFAQKKRLADAQRKLKDKETKSARNDERIAGNKIEVALEKLALLKGTQPHKNDDRIFPMSYAPIVMETDGRRVVRLARYHLRQAGKRASIDRQFPGLYNARRDNLEKFWRPQFTQKRALMLATSFFENVDRDGSNVVLHFRPQPAQLMWVACLYDEWQDPKDGTSLLSFAAVTDEPPPEVRDAGHDRIIINIQPANAGRWLNPATCSTDELQSILTDRQAPYYEHAVAAA